MNKSEHRHQLIRALITKNKIHTQAELQALLAENDIQVTQATLSRDIKNMTYQKSAKKIALIMFLTMVPSQNGKNVSNSTWKTPLSGCAQFNTKSY